MKNNAPPVLLLCVINILSSLDTIGSVRQAVDGEEFMDKLEKRLESLSVPSPDTMEEFLTQIEGTCEGNITVPLEQSMV